MLTTKEKQSVRSRAHYERNRGKVKESSKRWGETHPEARKDKAKRWRDSNRDQQIRLAKRWRSEHPEEIRAHTRVARAIQSEVLERPTHCPRCGKIDSKNRAGHSEIHAHHHDYSKPLEVEWACRSCHQSGHATLA